MVHIEIKTCSKPGSGLYCNEPMNYISNLENKNSRMS